MMKHFLVCLLVLACAVVLGQGRKNTGGQPFPKSVHKVLFLGNSITYQGDYITDIETYLITHFPGKEYEFINVGLPSETVSGLSETGHAGGSFPRPDLHERLARVLEQTRPDLVFANYGMNDGIYQPLDESRFNLFREGITWLHEEVVKSGARIVHLTPPLYDEKKGGMPGYNHVLDVYSDWLLAQKDSLGWNVVDIHGPMAAYQVQQQAGNPAFGLADDGVHPGPIGHWIMAKQVLLSLTTSNELIAADNIDMALAGIPAGREIRKLVDERQRLMKDAWLTATWHKRPGMAEGLPLAEARSKAAAIGLQIRALLPK